MHLGLVFRTRGWNSSDNVLVAQLHRDSHRGPFTISEGLGNAGREALSRSKIVLK